MTIKVIRHLLSVIATLSFLDEIRKQPRHIRETMFALSVITAISLVGIIWFRSVEEDLFVLLNPEENKQEQFYAERSKRTPTVYANLTEAFVNVRANIYDAMGFLDDYTANEIKVEDEEYEGEVKKLPLSGDK